MTENTPPPLEDDERAAGSSGPGPGTGTPRDTPEPFEYAAQTVDGHMMTGSIEAVDAEEATWQLQGLGLRLLKMEPRPRAAKPGGLSGVDFAAFNEQLAALTQANLPIERGLRLIAQDMRKGRLTATINLVANELEAGKTLPEAFDAHREKFPPAYASLIEAGIQSGDLPGVLMNMSRHLEMVQRLKTALWGAVAYPLMVLVALAAVMLFISLFIAPAFQDVFEDTFSRIPSPTRFLLDSTQWVPGLVVTALGLLIVVPLLWGVLQRVGLLPTFLETFGLRVPILGQALRQNLTARWCDAVQIAVHAGRDLPAAIQAASNMIGLKSVDDDSRGIIVAIETGQPLDRVEGLRVLPQTVPASIGMGAERGNLSESLGYLSGMYRNRAQQSFELFRSVLPTVLMLVIAALIAYTLIALFLPITTIVNSDF